MFWNVIIYWYAYRKIIKKHLIFVGVRKKNGFRRTGEGPGGGQKVTDMSATIRCFFYTFPYTLIYVCMNVLLAPLIRKHFFQKSADEKKY